MSQGIVESDKGSKQQQQGQQGATGKRSKLVERLLDASANLPAFMKDLLGTMAVTVAGTEAAGFIVERNPEKPEESALRTITHIRPDESDEEVRRAALQAFSEIIIPCINADKDGAIEVGAPDEGEPQFCLITLLRSEGVTVAAAGVITRCRDQDRAKQRLMSMQLVAGYFELYMMRRQMEESKVLARRHQDVLQLTTTVATAEGFEAAAMNFCNELSNRAGASRVSVGWIKGNGIKVRALSNTEKFDKKQDLIVSIKKVMEECLDQEEPVRFDSDGTRSENVTREAEALCRTYGTASVFSVPLRRRGEIVGIATLEFSPPNQLTDEIANALAVTGDLLAPQLYDRHENDRWLAVKVGHSIQYWTKAAIGPKHVLAKLIIFLLAATLLVLCNWVPLVDLRPMYKVSAPFQFVAANKRTLTAPFECYLESVSVKEGQRFAKGQLLAKMRTDDIKPQYDMAKAQFDENDKVYWEYRTSREPGAQARAQAALQKMAGAKAEMEKFKFQLDNAEIRAPFDGEVLKGSLDDKVGAPFHMGDELLQIAETTTEGWLKGELAVPERDVHLIRERPKTAKEREDTRGWTGRLASNSLPGDEIDFEVERIVQMADVKEGANTFKVYVELKSKPKELRPQPGMAGEARINADRKTIMWIWTHRLVDWLRLKLWM